MITWKTTWKWVFHSQAKLAVVLIEESLAWEPVFISMNSVASRLFLIMLTWRKIPSVTCFVCQRVQLLASHSSVSWQWWYCGGVCWATHTHTETHTHTQIIARYSKNYRLYSILNGQNWIRSVVQLTVLYQCQCHGLDLQYHKTSHYRESGWRVYGTLWTIFATSVSL